MTSARLRATWIALVLSGPVPMAALLEAANIRGDRSFGDIARSLVPGDPLEAVHALRGSSAPLAQAGQLLVPGHHHPAPRVPLNTEGQDLR